MRLRARRWLAGAAAFAGALAPLAGSPYRRARCVIDVAELARAVDDQEDHVSAVELAAWIRGRRPRLRVIDVRSATEFGAFHIPGAEHVALDRLVATPLSPDDTVVLYSETGIHAAQAWVFLRALGHRRVVFLRGGLREWLDDVMSPAIAADATPQSRAAFARVAELSRWFGGSPRVVGERPGAPGAIGAATAAAPGPVRGKGC